MESLDEWKQLKEVWGKSSLFTRIFLIANFAATLMAIASLADNIYPFHGFILTGIEFYREVVNYVFSNLNDFLDDPHLFKTNGPRLDGMIAYVLIFNASVEGHRRYRSKGLPVSILSNAPLIIIVPAFLIFYFIDDRAVQDYAVAIWVGGFMLLHFLIITGYSIAPVISRQWYPFTDAARFALEYLFTVIVGFAILAVISEGLARSIF